MIEYFDEARITTLLDMADLIEAEEAALAAFSRGEVAQPERTVMNVDRAGGFFLTMPAVADAMGVKTVTLFPGNADLGLHTHHALITLFNPDTGAPLAVMDGRLITEMRTAAVSAVATRRLADTDAHVLAILGSGVQARSHLQAMRLVRDIDEVRVWSRTVKNAQAFADIHDATAMAAEDAVQGADIVVCATSAMAPVCLGTWLKPSAHINAVGWNTPNGRELDDEAMWNAVVVEGRDAALAGAGNIRGSGCAIHSEIGEIINGTAPPLPSGTTTIFDSVGMAVEDIAAAGLVMSKHQGH